MNLELFKKFELPKYSLRDRQNLLEFLDKAENLNVCTFESDETGPLLHVVAFEEWPDFWLAAFDTEDELEEYCVLYWPN